MVRQSGVAALAALFISSGAARAEPAPEVLALGDYFGLRTVSAEIGGQTGTFVLDTGGGISIIEPALVSAAGCKPWGQITGFRFTGERLTMPRCDNLHFTSEGAELISPTAGVFDLSTLLPPEAPPLAGLIALDSLQGRPFTLELGASRLTLETDQSLASRTQGAVEVPIRFHRQAGGASLTAMVGIQTPEGLLWLQLDSGSTASMIVAKSSAGPLGLNESADQQPIHIAIAGVNGGSVEADTTTTVRDMIIDGNIGMPVMRHWIMTFDLQSERLWIAPAS